MSRVSCGIPDDFQRVATLEAVPDSGYITVVVGEYSILLARLDDEVYATENLCSHANSELAGGRFRRGRISCPLHGVIFDFRTGQVMGGTLTSMGLRTFDTRVQDDVVYVRTTPNERVKGIRGR